MNKQYVANSQKIEIMRFLSRTVEERMIELERSRQEKYGYDPKTAKVERGLQYCTMEDLK